MEGELEGRTRRVVVPALEDILYEEHKVLDRGFIRVVDYMGSDASIVQAARVSYGKGTKKLSQDTALIGYLMRHAHTSPFEMCEIKFHVKLPIFVARQWVRHRTANINECSARYSVVENEFYIPEEHEVAEQSMNNAQGRGAPLAPEVARGIIDLFKDNSDRMYASYESMLDQGLARELARMSLTLNCYTHWYWKTDLHNLLRFVMLRSGSGAQYELRAYAEKIREIVAMWVPITHQAFEEYCLESKTLSRSALCVIRRLLSGEKVAREDTGMGKREWDELMETLFPEQSR
ncbi:FAD-dependent thymidylate synthase [Candidatus Anaplasma sp. TIGMIC]|uniref:FAD-dependent thymidylate synthase n=1 Tax=Candidatus Anaplasma sp. TIGMIC TaxID=3020713 RepID=UPI0023308E54|nr:FAD-dependent thymidylate synthase [Candidatus Anaplasma sp. TIGMIC]MDB1135142.1 FAD-dependent thymidylate synthase [Candidatus Anaplasma sp. TIGMIC]